jgi:hypothetical protein
MKPEEKRPQVFLLGSFSSACPKFNHPAEKVIFSSLLKKGQM